jgi:hypothetical protein
MFSPDLIAQAEVSERNDANRETLVSMLAWERGHKTREYTRTLRATCSKRTFRTLEWRSLARRQDYVEVQGALRRFGEALPEREAYVMEQVEKSAALRKVCPRL